MAHQRRDGDVQYIRMTIGTNEKTVNNFEFARNVGTASASIFALENAEVMPENTRAVIGMYVGCKLLHLKSRARSPKLLRYVPACTFEAHLLKLFLFMVTAARRVTASVTEILPFLRSRKRSCADGLLQSSPLSEVLPEAVPAPPPPAPPAALGNEAGALDAPLMPWHAGAAHPDPLPPFAAHESPADIGVGAPRAPQPAGDDEDDLFDTHELLYQMMQLDNGSNGNGGAADADADLPALAPDGTGPSGA